jgi:hypothetical protein
MAGRASWIVELILFAGLPSLLDYGLEEGRGQEAGKLAVGGGVGDGESARVGVNRGLINGRLFEWRA